MYFILCRPNARGTHRTCRFCSACSRSSAATDASTFSIGLQDFNVATFLSVNATNYMRASFCSMYIRGRTSLAGTWRDRKQDRILALENTWINEIRLFPLMSDAGLPIWWDKFIVKGKKNDKTWGSNEKPALTVIKRIWEECEQGKGQEQSRVRTKLLVWRQQLRVLLRPKAFQKVRI